MSLFRKKSIEKIVADTEAGLTDGHTHQLHKVYFQRLARRHLTADRALHFFLSLRLLPVDSVHCVMQNLQAVFPLQAVLTLMRMLVLEK